jgi:hypothetical protein
VLPQEVVIERQLSLDLVVGGTGEADAAALGEALEARGDVDTVTVQPRPSTMTSPRLMPIRNRIWRASGSSVLRSCSVRWISTALSTASTTLVNSARTLSPGASTTRPPWRLTAEAMTSRYSVMAWTVAVSSALINRLYPSTSALRMAASLRSIERF